MASVGVSELFLSIQGEGLQAGLPCVFIRLQGCNLRCAYCDTRYALTGPGREWRVEALVERWRSSGVPLVEVTGGEPLIQPAAVDLLGALVGAGAQVLLETNGSLSLAQIPGEVVKIVDWKTPGSGHPDSFLLENLGRLSPQDQIKFVLTSREDYEWALSKVVAHSLQERCHLLFSPAWDRLHPALLARWIVEDRAPVRLQLQLHKVIWGDRRGV